MSSVRPGTLRAHCAGTVTQTSGRAFNHAAIHEYVELAQMTPRAWTIK
jgi:hypothetical protein